MWVVPARDGEIIRRGFRGVRFHSLLWMSAIVIFLTPVVHGASETSTCVVCHTSQDRMKALVVPPKLQVEGEG